jgi:hypothetical protein
MQELSEVALRAAPDRTPEEDRATTTLDSVNFLQVIQGRGIQGLRPRAGAHITEVETSPHRAQLLFSAALDVTRTLHDAQFAYSAMPQLDGRTGINSHTMASLIAERADQIAAEGRLATRYLQIFGNQPGIYPGSSTAGRPFTGPDYRTVLGLAHAPYALDPAYGRWGPDHRRRPIPRDWLMPYSRRQGHGSVLQPNPVIHEPMPTRPALVPRGPVKASTSRARSPSL